MECGDPAPLSISEPASVPEGARMETAEFVPLPKHGG